MRSSETKTTAVEIVSDKELAEQFGVEEKTVKLIHRIVMVQLGRKWADESGSEDTQDETTQEQPGIHELACDRIEKYYKNLDPRSKLAAVAIMELNTLEGINFQHGMPEEKKMLARIHDDLTEAALQEFEDPDDAWLAAVWQTCEMIQQNT